MSNSVAQTVDSLPRSVSSGTEADMAEQPATVANVIEIRVEEISQLFNTLDPFPFREMDLDKDAEEFIVGWPRELPVDQPLRIAVEALELGEALTRYFGYRARIVTLDLNELFRVGRSRPTLRRFLPEPLAPVPLQSTDPSYRSNARRHAFVPPRTLGWRCDRIVLPSDRARRRGTNGISLEGPTVPPGLRERLPNQAGAAPAGRRSRSAIQQAGGLGPL